jgi:hypothetical protein
VPSLDPLFYRGWLASSLEDPIERMDSLHQQLENEHGQAKEIVLRLTVYLSEDLSLEFRRREFRFSHWAAIDNARPIPDLERVHVHEGHQGRLCNQDVGLVHVTDNITMGVKCVDRGGEVPGGAMKIQVVEQGKVL